MWDSLPPGPHRIPAQGWWLARAARQRWTWGRVVSLSHSQCLRNYPSAGWGEGAPERDPPQALGLSPPRLLPALSPGSFHPSPPGLDVC